TIGSTDTLAMVELKAKAGVAYIGGNFKGILKSGFGNFPSAGGMDIFLTSFDNVGDLKMVKRDGGPEREEFTSFDVSNSQILVSGCFSIGGEISTLKLQSQSKYQNAFFAIYDGLGNINLLKEIEVKNDTASWGGIYEASAFIIKSRFDSEGNIILATNFTGKNPYGIEDYFYRNILLKFNSQGLFLKGLILDGTTNYNNIIDLLHSSYKEIVVCLSQGSNHHPGNTKIEYLDSSFNRVKLVHSNSEYASAISIEGENIFLSGNYSSYGYDSIAVGQGLILQKFNISKNEFSLVTNNTLSRYIHCSSITINEDNVYCSGSSQIPASFGAFDLGNGNMPYQFIARVNSGLKQPKPTVFLEENPIITCLGKKVKATAIFKDVNSFRWDIEGYQFSHLDNTLYQYQPEMAYFVPGNYSASLTISNKAGDTTYYFENLFHVLGDTFELEFVDGTYCYPFSGNSIKYYTWYQNGNFINVQSPCLPHSSVPSEYFLQVTKDDDCISISRPITFKGLSTESLKYLPLTLHPNPTSSHFTLSFEAEKADVTITDFSGRIMLQRQVKSNENISTSGFSKGIYFVQVRIGEEVVRRKLVIN
nr:T9SS type A sorting domain-containing protein [Bacteroidota bacterium]